MQTELVCAHGQGVPTQPDDAQPKVRPTTVSGVTRWSRLRESNPRPTHYECVALPTELRRPGNHSRDRRDEYSDWRPQHVFGSTNTRREPHDTKRCPLFD